MIPNKILLIDGNSIMNRAYYASKYMSLSSATGEPTGAIHSFMLIFFKQIVELKAEACCVAFDLPKATFRHELYKDYKAGRKSMDDELKSQMVLLKQLLDYIGIKRIELAGFEADDILGTISTMAAKEKINVDILTGDKDYFQLINQYINIIYPKSSKNEAVKYLRYNREHFEDEYKIKVEQFIYLKALMGDKSDNIPGIKGIGPKTATPLLQKYGDLEGIYHNIDEIKTANKKKLSEGKEILDLALKLSRINTSLDLNGYLSAFSDCIIKPQAADPLLNSFLQELGLKVVADKYKAFIKYLDSDNLSLAYESSEEKSNDLILAKIREGGDLSDLYSFLTTLESETKLIIAYSKTALSDKIKTNTKSLCAEGEYLVILPLTEDIFVNWDLNKIKMKNIADDKEIYKDAVSFYIGTELATRQKIAKLINLKKFNIITYSSRILVRDSLLDDSRNVIDLETVAYNVLEKPAIRSFPSLCLEMFPYLEQIFTQFDKAKYKNRLNLACLQLSLLLKIFPELLLKAEQMNLTGLLEELEYPLASVLGKMERRGIAVDVAVLNDLHSDFKNKIATLEQSIYLEAGKEFNIDSPAQLSEVLFVDLKLTPGKKTKTYYSTAHSELERIQNEHGIINRIINYRFYKKVDATFIVGLKKYIATDHRVHSSFNQNFTTTGRLSSKDPNLQNIPVRDSEGKEVRRAFVAPSGRVLIDADYSQIELRILAHMAQEEKMIEAFNNDSDIHRDTASSLFLLPVEKISKEQRSIGKTVNFSIIYGISAYGLSRDLGISVYEAKKYIEAYDRRYPRVRFFMDKLISEAELNSYVETMMGRRRYITDLKAKSHAVREFGKRAAMNAPIQGTAADIIRLAMLKLDEALLASNLDAFIVSQIHDELIVEAAEEQAEEVSLLMKNTMEQAFSLSVPLPVEISVARSWFNTK